MNAIESGTDSETEFGCGKTVTETDLRSQIFENHIFGNIVFACPTGLLQLDSLQDIICKKTWNELLSQEDRDQLKQMLPKVPNQDQLVESLLSQKENFFFGNPLTKFSQKLKEGTASEFVSTPRERWMETLKQNHNQYLFSYQCNMIKNIMKFKKAVHIENDEDKAFPAAWNPQTTSNLNVDTESEPETEQIVSTEELFKGEDGEDSFGIESQNHKKRRLDAC